MEQSAIIQQLLLQKYQRQKRLNKQFQELDVLESDLSYEQFGRVFGTSYLVAKRLITLIIGLFVTALALLLLIQPDVIFDDDLLEEVVLETGEDYVEEMEIQVENAWKEVYDNKLNRSEFSSLIKGIFLVPIREDLLKSIHFMGYLLLALGLIVLYISRLTRKMLIRNSRISAAQLRTKELIEEFKTYIHEDEAELAKLQEMVNNESSKSG